MKEALASKPVLERFHFDRIESLMQTMKYGSVTLIVQDGKIIQIEKTEKFRVKD